MNEAETRAELIDPALRAAGWGVVTDSRTRREEICPGRIEGAGRRGKKEIADYVLTFRNHKLAVIEAKAEDKGPTEGLAQAKAYAEKLQARFAFSTNGRKIYRVDMESGHEAYVEQYPTPDELWGEVFKVSNEWRNRFAAVPFEERGGSWQTRYYQHNAIENALEAIAAGKQRILLTLATGTGKTAIAFQIAWALFHSRWNLSRKPERRPRILFLADRNILADQAYNDFSAFGEDGARVRVKPEEIRERGRVPRNASVFFTIFQTFMSWTEKDGKKTPYFGEYSKDFFDFIIVDECHRGGANDESTWRDILEYFAPAVQLGMTATPRRADNIDTYRYFGDPVYVYSLKEGINDGFLTPFKVKQIATTLDDYVFTPDDAVVEGEVEEGRRYKEPQFNRTIEIEERERYRVKLFMEQIDQREKTLVFCANQPHAALVRDLINQMKKSSDPNYCVRVAADDGAKGEEWLRVFQDNEKTIPTILTTSQKLSTGVNARNVRNIVLMRPIGTMIEFKQIIGRGTRLFDGKDHFTIYDFVKAYEHFNDAEWDGEPMEPVGKPERPRPEPEAPPLSGEGDEPKRPRPKTIRIKLADGKERAIQSMMATSYWSPEGKPISANQMIEKLFGELPRFFKDEDQLRRLWSLPDTRKALLQGLAEKGFGSEQLVEIGRIVNAENSDVFDVLAYIAFALAPITRSERVGERRTRILDRYDPKLQSFLDFVLEQYVKQGVEELDQEKLTSLLVLKYHSVSDAIDELGGVPQIKDTFIGFQRFLYDEKMS